MLEPLGKFPNVFGGEQRAEVCGFWWITSQYCYTLVSSEDTWYFIACQDDRDFARGRGDPLGQLPLGVGV